MERDYQNDEYYGAYDDAPDEDCDHEYSDVTLEGYAECDFCGHRWWLTSDDMRHLSERQREYDRWCQAEIYKPGVPWPKTYRFRFMRRQAGVGLG